MTETAPAEGDEGSDPRPVAPIPYPPDPMAAWLATPPSPPEDDDAPDTAARDVT